MSELMTVEEVASYLRLNEKTVYKLLNDGLIPAMKIGRQWRFRQSAIDGWLDHKTAGGKAEILVIDDDEALCDLFKEALEEAGHVVTTVNDSLEGLELVRAGCYDLVFLDLIMPAMDGAEVFSQIRANNPELPVTIITGYPDSESMMKALTYGPFSIMRKPFSGSDILRTVNSYLRFGASTK